MNQQDRKLQGSTSGLAQGTKRAIRQSRVASPQKDKKRALRKRKAQMWLQQKQAKDDPVPGETEEEKKRRMNRVNARRKRARKILRYEDLNDQYQALSKSNESLKDENDKLEQCIALLKQLMAGASQTQQAPSSSPGGTCSVPNHTRLVTNQQYQDPSQAASNFAASNSSPVAVASPFLQRPTTQAAPVASISIPTITQGSISPPGFSLQQTSLQPTGPTNPACGLAFGSAVSSQLWEQLSGITTGATQASSQSSDNAVSVNVENNLPNNGTARAAQDQNFKYLLDALGQFTNYQGPSNLCPASLSGGTMEMGAGAANFAANPALQNVANPISSTQSSPEMQLDSDLMMQLICLISMIRAQSTSTNSAPNEVIQQLVLNLVNQMSSNSDVSAKPPLPAAAAAAAAAANIQNPVVLGDGMQPGTAAQAPSQHHFSPPQQTAQLPPSATTSAPIANPLFVQHNESLMEVLSSAASTQPEVLQEALKLLFSQKSNYNESSYDTTCG